MYANPLHHEEVLLDADDAADDKTVQWLKRDLERRRAEKDAAKKLVSSR
ncbi:MAG TPA: hypothetical protein VJ927_11650 [Actinomycetota bacterium]|nr:hypothetical protein [Actinomycetota bacterium]